MHAVANRFAVCSVMLTLGLPPSATAADQARASAVQDSRQTPQGQDLPQFADVQTHAGDRLSLGLTVYRQNLALIRDRRQTGFIPGKNHLTIFDVSDQLIPSSLQFSGGDAVQPLAWSFNQTPLTEQSLLRANIGHPVQIIDRASQGGHERVRTGTLLSVTGGVPLVRVDGLVQAAGPDSPWRIAFKELPPGVTARPSVGLDLTASQGGQQPVNITYLTRGLDWNAHYVGHLNTRTGTLNLQAWAAVANQTGVSFHHAGLQLLAGQPHRAESPQPATRMAYASSKETSAPREQVADYHLYTIDGTVDLPAGQDRQFQLFATADIAVKRSYRIEQSGAVHLPAGTRDIPVRVALDFDNQPPALGKPLPAGTVRIYGPDAQGRTQFLGEDNIGPTPAGQPVSVELGRAFDVTATRTQTDYRRPADKTEELAWKVALHNARSNPVSVSVRERMNGDWTIDQESQPHKKTSADTASWTLDVPAGGDTTLEYRVKIHH